MTSQARLLIGCVMHKRLRPRVHAFTYPVFYIQLPLEQLDATRNALFSIDRFNLLSFYRRDHGPRDGSALLPWIRQLLVAHGLPGDCSVTLQCFPRVFGYVFNPVSFWFCRDHDDRLVAVLAEVNNTFGGTHSYLLHNPQGKPLRDGQVLQAAKAFQVSPFCQVEGAYRFRFHQRRSTQLAQVDYDDYNDTTGALLMTSISGTPRPWSAMALAGALARMPFLTAAIMLRIHWQAFRLWRMGVPFRGTTSTLPKQDRHE